MRRFALTFYRISSNIAQDKLKTAGRLKKALFAVKANYTKKY
jgi:hypothetical protein